MPTQDNLQGNADADNKQSGTSGQQNNSPEENATLIQKMADLQAKYDESERRRTQGAQSASEYQKSLKTAYKEITKDNSKFLDYVEKDKKLATELAVDYFGFDTLQDAIDSVKKWSKKNDGLDEKFDPDTVKAQIRKELEAEEVERMVARELKKVPEAIRDEVESRYKKYAWKRNISLDEAEELLDDAKAIVQSKQKSDNSDRSYRTGLTAKAKSSEVDDDTYEKRRQGAISIGKGHLYPERK